MQEIDNNLENLIDSFLDEDLGKIGDLTSNYVIPEGKKSSFIISNRENMMLCGCDIAIAIFKITAKRLQIRDELMIQKHFVDGSYLKKREVILSGNLNVRLILAAERLVLNILQHLSGIATKTNKFVLELTNNNTKILDTRKTIPGLRVLQKYAVTVGGGFNHRMTLYDAILIKDNHIQAGNGISNTVKKIRNNNKNISIEVECDNLEQVKEAVIEKVDYYNARQYESRTNKKSKRNYKKSI